MARDLLEAMRRNPAGDWTIADLDRACRSVVLEVSPPRGGGSHYKIWDAKLRRTLTIPARRPLKPIYFRLFIAFVADLGADP
jgi:hypothetical protein